MINRLPEALENASLGIQTDSVSQDINTLLTLKTRVVEQLKSSGFPDLQFLFSPEALAVAGDILRDLLKQEKDVFQNILQAKNEDITFDMFLNNSVLEHYFTLLEHFLATNRNPEIEEILEDVREEYDAYGELQLSSSRYYEMLCYALEKLEGNLDQKRVLELQKLSSENAGVHLDEEKKAMIMKLKVELGSLAEDFMKHLTQARKQTLYHILDENTLVRLPQNLKDIGKKTAEEKGESGYIFECNEGNTTALLKYCDDTSLRKEIFLSLQKLAETENSTLVLRMIELRQELAQILGYTAYSQTVFQNKMALNVETVEDIYQKKAAIYRVEFEQDISQIKDFFGLDDIQAWDYLYYKEKYNISQRNVSEEEFQKYREFQNILSGIFEIFEKTFGISFEKTQIPTYDEDVKVYRVIYQNKQLGYYMPDFFSRSGKRQGAWADVLKKSVTGEKIVTNVANFTKSVEGNTYLTEFHIRVMFHELGHMLHELLSPQTYTDISGFEVEADAIEIPSKFMENLLADTEAIDKYMKHETTGIPLSEDMKQSFIEELRFGSAGAHLGRIERAFLDFALHGEKIPTSKEELQSLAFSLYQKFSPLGGFSQEDYSIYASFHHLFASATGIYASGYYSYIWSDILQEQIWSRVKEQGSIFGNPQIKKYMDEMLSQGARKPSMELFQKVTEV